MGIFFFVWRWVRYQYQYFCFRVFDHATSKVGVGFKPKRSAKWSSVQHAHLSKNPICAACGTSSRLNVHHIVPFHINPELELEPSNLITLCMDMKMCHLHIGHGGNFRAYNPELPADAIRVASHPDEYKQLVEEIEQRRQI